MALTIEREQEFVNQFHYDARNYEWEKENGTPETNLNVQFQLVPKEQLEKLGEGDTGIHAVLTYLIVLDNIVLSGFVSQLNYVRGQITVSYTHLSDAWYVTSSDKLKLKLYAADYKQPTKTNKWAIVVHGYGGQSTDMAS